MSYITPNSVLKLLRNCPLDKSQRDTWHFTSSAQQRAYFETLVMKTYTSLSYQRVRKGVIRIQDKADQLLACNYMMFQNTTYDPIHWFYAFVDQIEYVNDNTCNVYYTLDVIQTWYFTYTERPCYVMRMSVSDDSFGNNIEPEPFSLSEYVYNRIEQLDSLEPAIVVLQQKTVDDTDCLVYENVFNACQISIYGTESTGALEDLLANILATNPDKVIDMHMCLLPNGDPSTVCEVWRGSNDNGRARVGYVNREDRGGFTTNITIPNQVQINFNSTTLQGYKPKNKKLYTYPYNYLTVMTSQGDSMNLRYEFFDGSVDPAFEVTGNVLAPCCINIYPKRYKNAFGAVNDANYGEHLALSGFPFCSWDVSAFQVWEAQNSVPIAVNLGTELLSLGMASSISGKGSETIVNSFESTLNHASGAKITKEFGRVDTRNYFGSESLGAKQAFQVGVNSIADVFIQGYRASLAGKITKGCYQNGNIGFMRDFHHFYVSRVSIPNVLAWRIDQYFDAFGYAINAITTPQRHNRNLYTYVQTRNCYVDGDLPSEDRSEIEKIYNEGVRFWAYSDGRNIGDYDIDNNGTI